MNLKTGMHVLILTAFLARPTASAAQEEPRRDTLPGGPEEAWAQVQELRQALRPPDDWRSHEPTPQSVAAFQTQVRRTAWSLAAKTREFIERFPTNENVSEARTITVHALNRALAAGDADAEAEIAAFLADVLADKRIPENDRVWVFLYSGNTGFAKTVGMRVFTQPMSQDVRDQSEASFVESLRAAVKCFPTNSLIYTLLVSVAQRSVGERQMELALEVLKAPNASQGAKDLASHILEGTKPYQVGKPLDIRFTALDGRSVDLATLTGKVVIVQFWSTGCGASLAEMSEVKAAYQKLHSRGLEVVAISLDDNESAVRRFIQRKEIAWPQHFDGKGWDNRFAVQYGIFSIPTMWLVDKRGNLRDTNARGNLERRVIALLGEHPRTAK